MDDSENKLSNLMTKFKTNPSVPIGMTGLLGVLIYSAFSFKKKKIPVSLFLIQTRMAAQGTLVCCISLGLAYSLVQNHMSKYFSEKKN